MKEILSLTDNAVLRIREILVDAPEGNDSLLEGVDKSGCSGYSYKLDFANSNEMKSFEKLKIDGLNIYIDPKATIFLIGSQMDYIKDKLSSRFVFINPNEKSTCGCRESFNI